MDESKPKARPGSKTPKEILFSNRRDTTKSRFGTIACALWPTKTALNLSQRIGCTERQAQYYINGDSKPPARAIAIIVNEILD